MKNAKRVLSVFLCTLMLLPPLGLISNAEAVYGPGTKLVVLGDSIAAGEGASDIAKSYAELLRSERGFDLTNYAVGGHDSFQLMERLQLEEIRSAIAAADIINLSIGGNDLLHSEVIAALLRTVIKDFSLVEACLVPFRENFSVIIADIRSLNPDALFIVQNVYNPMDDVPIVGGLYETVNVMLNDIYAEYLAANEGAFVLADMHSAFAGKEGLVYADRIHPSDTGHALIAKILGAIIDGETLTLEPAPQSDPNFFETAAAFVKALVNYLSFWLSQMSVLELLGKVFSFL